MSTKKEILNDPESCFNKAGDDEPLFVLRANDPLAANIVEEWVKQAEDAYLYTPEKLDGAFAIVQEIRAWRAARAYNIAAHQGEAP